MKLAKPSSKYRTISLSDPLVEKIREIIADDSKFRSVADYVNIAIKEKMERSKFYPITNLSDFVIRELRFCSDCGAMLCKHDLQRREVFERKTKTKVDKSRTTR